MKRNIIVTAVDSDGAKVEITAKGDLKDFAQYEVEKFVNELSTRLFATVNGLPYTGFNVRNIKIKA